MIEFEVLKSPDPFMIGIHLYHKNHLTVGRTLSDINIYDKEIKNYQFTLEVEGPFLFIHLSKNISSILINRKRTTQTKKLNPNDIISVGHTEIKILNFLTTQYQSQKKVILENLNAIETDPSLSEIKEIINKTKDYLGHFNEI